MGQYRHLFGFLRMDDCELMTLPVIVRAQFAVQQKLSALETMHILIMQINKKKLSIIIWTLDSVAIPVFARALFISLSPFQGLNIKAALHELLR